MNLQTILDHYPGSSNAVITPFGSGLINTTWRIKTDTGDYILQKVNDTIFKNPLLIADNISSISSYLQHVQPEYFFVSPVKANDGQAVVYLPDPGYFRMFPFVKNSHTINVVEKPVQANEAALQFGLFTKMLRDFPATSLQTTLPDFHNLLLRYQQCMHACLHGNPARIEEAKKEIGQVEQYKYIVDAYTNITNSPDFKLRVTHHDTKISNVLFDEADKGLCVIDLDTVMPGYFISDVGDMMRTYLSPVSEEEKDLSKIEVRDEFFLAIVKGYFEALGGELTEPEKEHFVYSGLFMIYMQAVRFLTDHLLNDVYYGAAYTGQNLLRAQNQLVLLQRLLEKEALYKNMVQDTVIAAKN
ncbi:MAG: aminoglycoside phosphotransferase family protein [Chitinophagaceae bacterium]|nr:aminoglycoside phosphotransferase family protein [Chitinophagaceae bacterium]